MNIVDMVNRIHCGDCLDFMRDMPDECIDLTVTSPPYDNLRDYKGYTFDFEGIAEQLYRITKKGGVVVWVVGDATINGSETGTSFRQALHFKGIGFNLHDTMIWKKKDPIPLTHNRYEQSFEYMFVFSKGKPKNFNPIKVPTKYGGKIENMENWSNKDKNQSKRIRDEVIIRNAERIKHNTWPISVNDGVKVKHPAKFPEQLANDHIISWSNPGDIVYDPMGGSGTTIVQAAKLDRRWLMTEISEEYCAIAQKRVDAVQNQTKLKLETE